MCDTAMDSPTMQHSLWK